jgi:acetoacetyl-CoA synthetase
VTETPATARGELLWEPSAEVIESSNLTRYMRRIEREHGLNLGGDYAAAWRWSVAELEDFWAPW